MKTIVKDCKCKHEYQDATYGKGRRIHNYLAGSGAVNKVRCTVCTDEKTLKGNEG